jgi:hypothetical protein
MIVCAPSLTNVVFALIKSNNQANYFLCPPDSASFILILRPR